MRRDGYVPTAAGLGLHGHACWAYGDEADFRAATLEFLEDGVELGQRLMYVAAGSVQQLRDDLRGLRGLEPMLASGGLRIMPLENAYAVGSPVDPAAQLTMYSAATSAALVDGYTGLRVVAEVTPLVHDPELWATHTHWESVADRYMAKNPMAALCCYDRRALPDEILADLACVHRSSNRPAELAPFHLDAGREGLSLSGEVDCFSAERLGRMLEATSAPGTDLVLELDQLEFIDHNGLFAIADHAARLADVGHTVQFRGAPPSFDKLTELLEVRL